MQILLCASMAHVIDRAVAFRFAGIPYVCGNVTPDSVTLYREVPIQGCRHSKRLETVKIQVSTRTWG